MSTSLFSPRDAAAILGVEEARLRRWARSGIVVPSEVRGRRRLFTFNDLIAAKAAKELFERGVSERAVRKNLFALAASLPAGAVDRPLSRLRVVSDGEELVLVGDDVAFEPLSGQVVMDFVVGALSTRAAEVMALPPGGDRAEPDEAPSRDDGARSGYALFTEALALEKAGHPDDAAHAYRRALARDPHLAAAHTNLGHLAWAAGRRGEARERFEQALAIDPDQPEARYNLASVLAAAGEIDRAVAEWTRVAALHPTFADAHFNLGVVLAWDGRLLQAAAALERYLGLVPAGESADAARALLVALTRRIAA